MKIVHHNYVHKNKYNLKIENYIYNLFIFSIKFFIKLYKFICKILIFKPW